MAGQRRGRRRVDDRPTEVLRGKFVRARYQGERFFTIGEFEPEAGGASVTVCGSLPDVRPGDCLALTGWWETHEKFGLQFKVKSHEPLAPADDEGMIGWLDSTFTGIGRHRAIEIVRTFGRENVFRIIEETPDRLAEISGITVAMTGPLVEQYRARRSNRDAIVFLKGFGLTDWRAGRLLEVYGADKVADILRANPYRLIEDVAGFGFTTVDEIALRMGVEQEAPGRLQAGVLHVLSEASEDGHTRVPRTDLVMRAADLLGVGEEALLPTVDALVARGAVVPDGSCVALPALYEAEVKIATCLRAILEGGAVAQRAGRDDDEDEQDDDAEDEDTPFVDEGLVTIIDETEGTRRRASQEGPF